MRGILVLAVIACGCEEHGKGGPRDAAAIDAPNADALPSGRACDFAMRDDPTAVASPALDCPSRICVHVNGFTPDQCTAECETADDCVIAPESPPCSTGFVCTPIVAVGPFACRSFCVCGDRAPITACP